MVDGGFKRLFTNWSDAVIKLCCNKLYTGKRAGPLCFNSTFLLVRFLEALIHHVPCDFTEGKTARNHWFTNNLESFKQLLAFSYCPEKKKLLQNETNDLVALEVIIWLLITLNNQCCKYESLTHEQLRRTLESCSFYHCECSKENMRNAFDSELKCEEFEGFCNMTILTEASRGQSKTAPK